MKKILSRVLAMALALLLFTAPSTVSAASTTSTPVLTYTDGILKMYKFQPDAYYLTPGNTLQLRDITASDGRWYVPAGRAPVFVAWLADFGDLRVRVADRNSQLVYDSGSVYSNSHVVSLPAKSIDEYYIVWITAQSGLEIEGYDGFHN